MIQAIAVWLMLATAAPVAAAPPMLVLTVDDGRDALVREAGRRLAAELALRGMDVVARSARELDGAGGTEATLRRGVAAARARGGIALARAPGDDAVTIVSLDARADSSVVREVAPDAASVLAVKAVEVLRAHFLERELAPAPVVIAPSSPPTTATTADRRVAVAVGAAVARASGVGDGWVAPAAQLRLELGRWRWRAAISGLGSSVTTSAAEGSASITERSTTVAIQRSWGRRRVRGFAGVEAGVIQLVGDARAAASYAALDGTFTTTVAAAVVGGELTIAGPAFVEADLGIGAWRRLPTLQIVAQDRVSVRNPVLTASLWAGARW
jgi:hypothetical protein